MTKYVRETKAGKSISAYIILKGGKRIATVLSHYGDGGSVLVNVFQYDKAAERSAIACGKTKKKDPPQNVSEFCFQHARAGGYGYDKLTAALAGLWIDGHKLTDHCGESIKLPEGRHAWPKNATPPKGYSFANYLPKYLTFGFETKKHKNPNYKGQEGYTSCYRISGLKYLEAIGYTVEQVL